MKTSDTIGKLAEALAKAQAVMEHAKRDALNPHFGKKYADFGSCVEVIRKPLSDNGLSFVQALGGSDGVVSVSTRLMHVSGEFVESECSVKPEGPGAQKLGSAATYLRRYALSAIVGLASEEDDDGNAASPAPKQWQAPKAAAPRPAAKTQPASTPKAVAANEPPPHTDADAPAADVVQDVPTATTPPVRPNVTIGFGSQKGKAPSELTDKDLNWYRAAYSENARNPEKARYAAESTHMVSVLDAEIRRRKGG